MSTIILGKHHANDLTPQVGTGYSQGKPNANSYVDVAAQFLPFWKRFVDLFDLHNCKTYITGESYAGMYCPYIAAAMLDQNDTAYFDISGLMIYDPSFQYDVASQVSTVPFVDAHPSHFPFNDTYNKFLHNLSDACGYTEYIENALTFPPAGPFIDTPGLSHSEKDPRGYATEDCDVYAALYYGIIDIDSCFNIYQVGALCPLLWDVLRFPYTDFYMYAHFCSLVTLANTSARPMGFREPYFNRTDVKQALHAPEHANWTACTDIDVFVGDIGDLSPPSDINGGPLQKVIESTNNVIVAHGALDAILIANGTLLTLNNLTWNGVQGFSQPTTEPFFVPYHDNPIAGSQAGAGVFGGFVTERGLTFVAVVLAGHELPEYTASAGYKQVEYLLGRIGSLDEVSPFTTQPEIQQPDEPLGRGTWWSHHD